MLATPTACNTGRPAPVMLQNLPIMLLETSPKITYYSTSASYCSRIILTIYPVTGKFHSIYIS